MPDFVVSTGFRVTGDKISPTFVHMGKNADKFGDRVTRAFKRGRKEASLFRTITKSLLVTRAITAATSAVTRGIRSMTTEFVDFDSSIGRAAAKFPTRIKRGTDAFTELENKAREIGATTEFTAAQAAQGLEEYAKAGIDAATAMGLLAGTAELATNANVEFAEAASISLDALDIFGLRSKNAAETIKNLARVNDTLTSVVNSAKLEMEDFAETLKFTGPVGAVVGATLEDVAAATGLVAKAGIRGSLAGTALKNAYIGLAAQTPKAQKVLKNLGVQAIDPTTGDLRDMLDVLVDFSAATEDMGNAQRLAAINTVFGRRAVAGVSKIMALGADEIANYRDRLNESKGASKEMAVEIRKSLENRLLTLKSAAIEVGFKFLDAFKGEGVEGIDALTQAVREFDIKPVVEAARDVLDALKWMFRTVRDNWELIQLLAKAFVAVKIALIGISFAKAIGGALSFVKAAALAAKAGAGIGGGEFAGGKVTPAAARGAPAAGGIGAAGKAQAVAAAAAMGAAIGTILEQTWLDPMRKAGEKAAVGLNNLVVALDRAEIRGFEKLSPEDLANKMKQVEIGMTNMELGASSFEEAFGDVIATITGGETTLDKQKEQMRILTEQYAKLQEAQAANAVALAEKLKAQDFENSSIQELQTMLDLVKEKYDEKILTGMDREAEEMQRTIELYQRLEEAMKKATEAAAAMAAKTSKVDVGLEVDVTAPEGSAVTTKAKGGSAPKVNQGKAGKT